MAPSRRPRLRCRYKPCPREIASRSICHETEEVFFILEGECLVRCWEGGESCDIRLGRWDLVALPPFLNHEIFNDGPGDCHVQTLLAKPQPLRPQYADPQLLELQAAQG